MGGWVADFGRAVRPTLPDFSRRALASGFFYDPLTVDLSSFCVSLPLSVSLFLGFLP